MRRRQRVTIVYKSGAVMRFRAKYVATQKHSDGTLASITWEDGKPEPFVLGLNEIAAVYVR